MTKYVKESFDIANTSIESYFLEFFGIGVDEFCDKHNCVIAGGSARAMYFNAHDYSDIDIYILGKTLEDRYKIANCIEIETDAIDNNLTKDTGYYMEFGTSEMMIQVIYGDDKAQNLQSILDSFDFTVCVFGYQGGQIYYHPNALYSVKAKELYFNNIRHINSIGARIVKYAKKGYTINTSTFNAMLKEVLENEDIQQKIKNFELESNNYPEET